MNVKRRRNENCKSLTLDANFESIVLKEARPVAVLKVTKSKSVTIFSLYQY